MISRISTLIKPISWRINWSEILFQTALLLLALTALFFIILIKSKTANSLWSDPLIFAYTILVTTFQLSRVVSAIFFKNAAAKIVSTANQKFYEPRVSFVIPCKNEEKAIAKTVTRCFEADYPQEKIEVIVINDGSTDNTIQILRVLENKFENLTIIDWQINRGKRRGMAEGFKRATGEIVIQLDSDSYIEPKTFRQLIKLFQNPEIGAVCIHADPENREENWLTKMQAAYYFVSFRILKAAESTFMTVFCCSGCSSAYRKKVVLPIIDLWLQEKFLGQLVTWGDDRALTNWVLKQDYKTIYTDEVQAFTIVPNTLKQFLKQQTRWKKGWFVNSIFASQFIYKKQPFVSLSYFFPLILVTLITPLMATRALIFNPIFRGIVPTFYITGVFLVACIITLYYRSIARENKYWPYVFVWSAINMIVLSFILVYALLTIQNRRWGTR